VARFEIVPRVNGIIIRPVVAPRITATGPLITEETTVQDNVREQLAAVQHDIWAHWTRYQFGACQRNEDGSITIPADKVERWSRQMETPYSELTDKECESDREQADKIILAIRWRLEAATLADVYGKRAEAAERERDAWKQEADDERKSMRSAVRVMQERAEAAEAQLALVDRYGADQWRRGNAGQEPQEFGEWQKEAQP